MVALYVLQRMSASGRFNSAFAHATCRVKQLE